ncbi:hypothetical protein GOZ81_14230 [Agrobacterium vitis]|nr:hypothetical protein [Agrobacterium vitis]
MTSIQPALTVPLWAKKAPALVGELVYRRIDLPNGQKRLAGRYALQPVIDLDHYRTSACIDWLTISVSLSRLTQFQWIQAEISGILGRTPFVENTRGGKNDSSTEFDVRFQEPDIATVLKVIATIEAKFGLATPPILKGIEISIDFTPRTPRELERAKIARVLMNHLLVEEDVISNLRDRPRTVWGRDERSITRLIYDSKHLTPEENKRFLIETERDRAPFTDATLEIGAKEANVRWRVMDKIIDRQNVEAGTFVALQEVEKRARIEVTLGRPEVQALGIDLFSDLKDLNFTRLQGRYFRFFLPTFSGQAVYGPGTKTAIIVWQDQQRALKFAKSGGLGLKAMDSTLAEQRFKMKRQALKDMHSRGLRLPRDSRIGGGLVGSFISYEELNERVRTALRNLGRRVVDGFELDA